MDLGLGGRVCVVTGSTSGIGLATAGLLANEGARVVVCGRDSERVERARREADAVFGVVTDLSEPGAPDELVAQTRSELGPVEVLVNNVGEAYHVSFDDLSDHQWDEMWQLNVMSYVRCIRAVLPAMRDAGGGVIVNVSSTAGKRPSTGMPNYSVTKAAVLSLSRLVADLYAHAGIRCNAVTPGPTATEAWLGEGRLADRVAYINHDIDDALRAGVLSPEELPRGEIELLGPTGPRRIDTLVHDLVETSDRAGEIRQSDEIGTAMLSLRAFMFERVYLGPHAQAE